MPIRVPTQKSPKGSYYTNFKGVDFSCDPVRVEKNRAADMLNMISDKGGLPEKRLGFRTLHGIEAPVNGLYYGYIGEERVFIAHGGSKLYKWTDHEFTVIKEDVNNARSSAFFMKHEDSTKLFILTGNDFIYYDGTEVKAVQDIAKVPLIIISKNPDGTGGTTLQGVNLIQPKRREGFLGNGSTKVYQLTTKDIDTALVTVKETTSTETKELVEIEHFTVDRVNGQVSFKTAPLAPPVSGQDNIEITYSKTVEGYADRIKKCTISEYYGLGGSNRVFVTGNDKYRAYDWWCQINDPTYFADLSYAIMGNDNTAVMGYSKLGEYLLIIKEDNQQDSTIFIRNAQLMDGEAVFPVKQGVTGVGAISKHSFVNLIDEPLFLSRTGVYAITSNTVTAERTLQNRSYYVDARLTKEPNLHRAVACEWNGYYIIAVNGNVYLLDSRQKSGGRDSAFVYECYFWNNIYATCFLVHEGMLYFGTDEGQICKLNTDNNLMSKYSDNGTPIKAYWDTGADDDGTIALLKTMEKKGGTLTIKPSVQTGADIYISIDGEPWELLVTQRFSLIDWENLSYESFSFFTTDTPKRVYFNQKVKKYTTLQFRIENSRLNASFGIYELTKYFTKGNYGKG